MLEDEHMAAGRFLGENLDGSEWLIVHSDAGAIPYHSKLKTLDCGRLNDEYLTDTDLSADQVCDYLFSRNPAAMVFTSTSWAKVEHGPEAKAILRHDRFVDYRLVRKFASSHRTRYFEFVYIRSDLADSLGLEAFDAEAAASEGHKPSQPQNEREISEDIESADKLWEFAQKEDDRAMRRSALEKFVRQYVEDPRAPEALWALSTMIDVPMQRIERLRMLCDRYPSHDAAPKALFMIGFIYSEEIRDMEKARKHFEECIAKYPETESAQTAKTMLDLGDKNTPTFE
jgi:hypothetical protein